MAFSQRFEEALLLACRLHAPQLRKGTTIPYISHLMGVCGIALDYGANEEEAIAALLHDAPEDQGGQAVLDVIRYRFGNTVADIVAGCTDTLETPKPPWRARKEAYIKHLRSATPSVRLVSMADKLHNASAILRDYRELEEGIWERFQGGRESLWYYRALADTFLTLDPNALARELDRVVTELEKLTAA